MSDLRSPLAKARDEYFTSQGRRLAAGIAQGQYLRNRLEDAFCAGANWAETYFSKPSRNKLAKEERLKEDKDETKGR